MNDLNLRQLEAVAAKSRDVAAIAGPGSGKTRVLIARIERLLESTTARNIAVMTFTNAGAHELIERYARQYRLGKEHLVTPAEPLPAPNPLGYVGTVHGFCFRLLQRFGYLIGYRKRGVTIIPADEHTQALIETCERLKLKMPKSELMAGATAQAELVHRELRFELKRNNTVNYDRILEDGLALLQKEEVRREFFFGHLLIDEAQDSGTLDWEIYAAIPTDHRFIVGDPDQSIYGFRGGKPGLLVEYAHTAELITLDANYRSTATICQAASRLIAHNTERIEKEVVSASVENPAFDPAIVIEGHDDEHAELDDMVRVVKILMEDEDLDYKDIAVLTRTNTHREEAAAELRLNGLPVAKTTISLPQDWQRAMLLVSLFVDPANDLNVFRWLELQKGINHAKAVRADASVAGITLAEHANVVPLCFKPILDKVPQALAMKGISNESVDLIESRIKLLPQVDPTVADLLHDLWNHPTWNAHEENGVDVLTIHGAKGREWEAVICLGWEEGVMPQLKATTDIEEERRLAFVAITRAKRFLNISHCERRKMPWGEIRACQPSRFIGEAFP